MEEDYIAGNKIKINLAEELFDLIKFYFLIASNIIHFNLSL